MAFDACIMRAVIEEFRSEFPEAKIEKVLEPLGDEIDLIIHHGRVSRRLVFNVGPNAPRLQLSDTARENPTQAPMFCMLLRKYFAGARIVGVHQLGFDRIAVFTVSAFDEMGYRVEKKIVCEIMGKYANLIILDSEDKVLAAMKVIDFAASTVRQVLPGLKYQIPAVQDKICPLDIDTDTLLSKLSEFPPERTLEKFITTTMAGIATQIAHELTYRVTGSIDVPVMDVDRARLVSVVTEWQTLLREHKYTPTALIDKDGKPIDYSYMDITYHGESAERVRFDSFRELFDTYFSERDRLEKIRRRGRDLITIVSGAIARTEKKLAIQREALADSARGEEYKRNGDLITSNLYQLERGMTSFECVDYYDESCPTVTISLDSRLSPAQNAQRMYKLYNKAKTAREVLTEQIAIWERELLYLESVMSFIERAEGEDDLAEIRDELYRSGYSSRMKGYKPPKQLKSRPMRFTTSGGYTLLVGRNNLQNDQLTHKIADRDDLWFHTKDIPGSHVIMQTGGEEPSERDYTEAAAIAAYYSQATGDTVAVDYTKVRNIKKPSGAKPGFVIYKTNYTAYVKPMSGEELSGNG